MLVAPVAVVVTVRVEVRLAPAPRLPEVGLSEQVGGFAAELTMLHTRLTVPDAPVELKLKDGNTLKQKVEASTEPGTVQTVGSGVVAGQTVPLNQVVAINPPPVKWTGSIKAGLLVTKCGCSTTEVEVPGSGRGPRTGNSTSIPFKNSMTAHAQRTLPTC